MSCLETLRQVLDHFDGRVFRVCLQIIPAGRLGVATMPRCLVTLKQSSSSSNFHQSYPRLSTDNMDITDCVFSSNNMEYYENRLRTFDTSPKQILPDKNQLARAGLYYTGKSDICQCFRCHV